MLGIRTCALGLLCASIAAAQQKPGAAEGRVVDAASGEPIRKALVILSKSSERQNSIGAYTDFQGAFRFETVEPGSYTVTAQRDGWVSLRKIRTTVVNIQPEKTETDITLKLQRTGAISGRVVDADGDPIANASVIVHSIQNRPGDASALTNDRGEYRAFNIAPGKYQVKASSISRLQQVPNPPVLTAKEQQGYRATWHPGTTDHRQATVVDVAAGADLQGFDIQLVRSHAVRVSGRVISPSPIALLEIHPADSTDGEDARSTVMNRENGAFAFADILPGEYELEGMAMSDGDETPGGSTRITVGNSDLEGVELTLVPPQKVTGRIVVPEGHQLPAGWMAYLSDRIGHRGRAATVAADGTFQIRRVLPGDYALDAAPANTTGGSNDFYVSAIRAGDDDVSGKGLHVGPGPLPPIEIVLAGDGGSLAAVVLDDEGVPLANHAVMLRSDDPRDSKAFPDVCNTNAQGTCTIHGIRPGQYHVFAFAPSDQPDAEDKDRQKANDKYGKALTISPAQHAQIQLQPVPEQE